MVTYRSIEQTINTITYLVRPHRLGVVARMYPDNTLNFIVDGLRNVFYKDEKPTSYELSTSLLFEWQVETNNIKHVEFAEVPSETGDFRRL